jgi:hypothetical protein
MDSTSLLNGVAAVVRRGISANRHLCLVCEAQTSLLNDLSDAAVSVDRLQLEIASTDSDLTQVSATLSDSRALLKRLLCPRATQSRAGPALRLFLANTEKAIGNLVSSSLARGSDSVGVDGLLDIEEHIARLILSLKKAHLFPESDSDTFERTEAMEQHNERLARFLHHC